MAFTAPTGPAQPDGVDGLLLEMQEKIPFYEKLARLQAEVYAGRHPRVKLPGHVLARVAPQQSAPTVPPTTNGLSNGHVSQTSSLVLQNGTGYPLPKTVPSAQRGIGGQRPPSSKPTSSGIDPVLLTPSDTLIRAEIQLKRQRIERALKDQVDAKKGQGRDRDFEPGFASDILLKAQQLVPPISGLPSETDDNSPSHESFDTNDYYSSQVMSWSTESSEPGEIADGGNLVVDKAQDVSGTLAGEHGVNGKSSGDPFAVSLDDHRVDQTGIGADQLDNQQRPPSRGGEALEQEEDSHLYDDTPMDLEEGEREESYSPPAADAFTVPQQNTHTQVELDRTAVVPPANAPRYPFRYPRVQGMEPPSPDVPVIRNHIRSPVAPQPARVSPLTYNKLPRIDQSQLPPPRSRPHSPRSDHPRKQGRGPGRAKRPSPKNSARQSPAPPQEKVKNPKKRRREAAEGDNGRRASDKRVARSPVARSPEMYIKEEPVSPPPFAGLSEVPTQRQKVYRELPGDVEIVSPRQSRTRPVYYREQDPAQPIYAYELDEPVSPAYVRVPSRTAYRRIERDETDLRRVASLQYARRPYSPAPQTLPYSPVEGRPLRAASYAVAERARAQEPIYREASVRPAVPRYVRSERSMSPVEQYVPRTHTPSAMAPPPPREVVVDQYGNKYYAAPPSEHIRASMAPQHRRVEAGPYVERAPTRESVMRAPVRIADPYDDQPSVASMPPQPLRRYVEQPDVEVVDHRAYRQRDYSMRPPEPVERPVIQYEDMPPPPPREYVTRSYSVRPEPARQEVEYVPRHGSVVPAREYVRRAEPRPMSIARTEYAPIDDQRYSHMPQAPPLHSRRYMDEHVEVVQAPYEEGVRRVSYRY